MAQTLKRTYAGPVRIEALYPRGSRYDTTKQRGAKMKASSEAQRRMNRIYSYQKLELALAVNFPTPGSALVVVLTFDDEHLPKDRAAALRRLDYFREKLNAAYDEAGLPRPVIFWAPEVLTSASGRWHFHLVMTNSGHDLEILRRCWIYGSDIEAEKLRVDAEKNHETLAKYMTKELRECQDCDSKPGLHGWSCTRNAKKPETETLTVPDDFQLEPPEDCTVLIDERRSTEWASWHVIKYRFGAEAFARAPRAKRRRQRRE
ncbi:MAG: hypothetical protein J6T26_08045 [Firmicutes bacterium]|nr:hypothetical protein [Bacillota bacterium]